MTEYKQKENSEVFVCGKSDQILTTSSQILEKPGNTVNRRFVFPVALLFSSSAPGFKNGLIFKLKLQQSFSKIHQLLKVQKTQKDQQNKLKHF